jgi:hypothetical protein
MNSPAQLYKLQHIDQELHQRQQALDEIETQLSDDKALAEARAALASQKARLTEVGKRQKEAEWELEDLQQKVDQVNAKLYGGKVKNPKELVNLDLESKELGKVVRQKEDALLELMSEAEDIQAKAEESDKELKSLSREWRRRQQALTRRKSEVEAELAVFQQSRQELAAEISPEALALYDEVRTMKERAVAKVARGRCQGCHINLPTTQWQKAKAGNLVQCDSCHRILYVE